MENKNEAEIFEIIAHGGNAKSLAYEALNSAAEGNFEEAKKHLDESEHEMAEVHKTQTRLIQDEINGEKVDTSLLMIHAQDHLMTALSEKSLIEKMIELYKKLEEKWYSMRLLYILGLLILLVFCRKLSQLIIRKVAINRWLLLVIMPFIIGIPIMIFDEINTLGWTIIYFLIIFNSILFFEKSRQLLENKKIKGVIYKSEEGK